MADVRSGSACVPKSARSIPTLFIGMTHSDATALGIGTKGPEERSLKNAEDKCFPAQLGWENGDGVSFSCLFLFFALFRFLISRLSL